MMSEIMKRIIMSIGVIIAAIFTLTNCNKEMDAPGQPEENLYPFEFSAAIATRTVNAGDATLWEAGDAVNLFHSPAGASEYVSNGSFSIDEQGLESATFKGNLASPLVTGKSYDWVAVYPYVAANTDPASVKLSIGASAQNGDGSMAHLAGEQFPIWGTVSGVNGDLEMTMKHLSSILEVEVINSTTENIVVSSVSFTAQEEIAGEFVADLTSATPSFTAVSDKASKTSSLAVSGAQNIEKGASAKYYLAVKPFTAPAGSALTLSVNGIDYEIKLAADVVFAPGAIKPLKFDYDKTGAPSVTVKNIAFSECDLEWTTDGLAKSFNIYVNGEKKVSDVAANVLTYHLTGLVSGEESVVEVEAVGDHNAAKSAGQTVKTAGIRMLDNGRHHVVIEWDEVGKVYNGTTGSGSEYERGYYIGVYKDAACTQPVYEFIPYDAMTSRYYGFATSSLIGKVGGKSYWIPTRIGLGSLDEDTEYFVRLKTNSGFSFSYSGTTYTLKHPYGNSEWSSPVSVRTKPARQAASGEVIFADFDELSILPDRHIGAIGTLPASKKVGDRADMHAISIGYTVNLNIDTYGIASIGTNESDPNHKDYYNGKYFNVDIESATSVYSNYIINEGYELAGWHFSSNVRPAMGTVVIDRARNRMIGTPALTKNLGEEPTLCVLTFDQCVFLNAAPAEDILKIWIYRDGALSDPIHTYTVKDTAISWTDGSNYKVDYEWITKSFPLSLKSGDAVLIGTNNETVQNYIAFDNFKIAVHEGSGSLEIPDWGNDNSGLEF